MRLGYRDYQELEKSQLKVRSEEYAAGYMVVYLQDAPMITATIYLGKAKNPYKNFRFPSIAKREEYIKKMAETITANRLASIEYKIKQKAEGKEATKKFLESLVPGKLLYDTWGYDQTNVEFYEVIRRVGSKVTIRELGHVQVGEPTSWASNKVVPATGPDRFAGPEVTKNVRGRGIKICSSICLQEYHGGEIHKSWYA
jgi:hypothetical protein